MKLPEQALMLKIFIGESDRHNGKPLYEQIVLKARELHLAGATVTRGILGFGASSRIHTSKILELSEDLPVVIEIVDTEENIGRLMPFVEEAVEGGLVTLEKMKVIAYRHVTK